MTTTTTQLPTGTWTLQPSATSVIVSVKKLGFLTVPATLTVVSGSIEIDGDHQVSNVEVIADATTYDSGNAKRDEHVLGPDFLDSGNFATIDFRSGRVGPTTAGYTAAGTLTIKGQTSPVEVVISAIEIDGTTGSFTATATVDRTTIGVDKMPTFFIGRHLELVVSAKAIRTS